MYSIYQIDHESNEKIIGNIASEILFVFTINDLIKSNYTVQTVDNKTFEDIKNDVQYTKGYYLLSNVNSGVGFRDKQIQLVEKSEKLNKGYVWNAVSVEVEILFTWRLIPYGEVIKSSNGVVDGCNLDGYVIKKIGDEVAGEVNGEVTGEVDGGNVDGSKVDIDDMEVNTKINTVKNYTSKLTNADIDKLYAELLEDENQCKAKMYLDKLPFSSFNLDTLCSNPQICLIGKRGTGKTRTITNIIDSSENKESFTNMLIICPVDKYNSYYVNKYPQAKVLHQYNNTAITEYLMTASSKLSNNQHFKGCVVLDDCLSSRGDWAKDKAIMKLFYNHKSYDTTFLVAMQFSLGFGLDLRINFDYIFLYAEDFYSNQKRLYDHYGGIFPSFDIFRKNLLDLTTEFRTMVICNRNPPVKNMELQFTIENKVFYHKAK